jgi:uncharacterized protein YigE (DUF2233 family)
VSARLLVFGLICWVSLGIAPATAAGNLTHTPPNWRAIGRGLNFTQVDVLKDGEVLTTLAVVKIDPAANAFRVFHQAPQSITAWQQQLGAPIVFNGSYYDHRGKPIGLIVSDGAAIGPPANRQMRGMFVAEPKGISPDLPRATILDLKLTPINPKKLPWTQGLQSFPLLLDFKGHIRVRESGKHSHRTVIAADRVGNILVFNTFDGFFTLHNFAVFLKDSKFDIDSALNLDGGTEAQLLIKTKDFEFFSPPSWETSIGNLIDEQKFFLPTVVGVFPRKD